MTARRACRDRHSKKSKGHYDDTSPARTGIKGLHQGFQQNTSSDVVRYATSLCMRYINDCNTSMTATIQTAGQLMQAYFIQCYVLSCDAVCHKTLLVLSIKQLTLKQSQQKMRQEVQGLDHQQHV